MKIIVKQIRISYETDSRRSCKESKNASAETLTTYGTHRSLDDFTYLSHDEIAAAAIPIAGAILGATYGYQNNL